MAFYELVFIVRQDVSVTEVEKVTDSYAKYFTDNDGKVLKREYWGLRSLAYEIRKCRKGHYIMLVLETTAKHTAEIERRIKINEDILRSLIVKIDEVEAGPSSMMSQTSDEEVVVAS